MPLRSKTFTTPKTVTDIIKQKQGLGDVFFYCSPCTGGSTWQQLNLELAKRKGYEGMFVKLIDHWDLHWRLWTAFELVVSHCREVGATVLLEWPRFCEYCREKKVYQFVLEMKQWKVQQIISKSAVMTTSTSV